MKARVTYGLGRTVPIGNYENFKLHCEVQFECQEDELEETYEKAKRFVVERVEEEEAFLLGKFD